MTKITIVSGFLGAGKTTLLRKLIAEAFSDEKLVLIENEFGEVGIDAGFLQDAGITVTEMNSGCICCSLVGDFEKNLQHVLATYAPDRILIEPSGVGKLSDVKRAVQTLGADVALTGAITVADATKCKLYSKNFGEFFENQIEHADAIVLSRTAGLSVDKLAQAVALLRTQNASAPIVTTPWDSLTGAQLVAAMEQKDTLGHALESLTHAHTHEACEQAACSCGHKHQAHAHTGACTCGCGHDHEAHQQAHTPACGCGGAKETAHTCDGEPSHPAHEPHHHAEEIFQSVGVETVRSYSADSLSELLQALESGAYGMVLRAKGMVQGVNGTWLAFDFVPGEHNIRSSSAELTGRICIIGVNLQSDALHALLQA